MGNSCRNTSVIDPQKFNIHEIKGIKQSGFFDFMIPDYPTNTCASFQTVSENGETIILKLLPVGYKEDFIHLTDYLGS